MAVGQLVVVMGTYISWLCLLLALVVVFWCCVGVGGVIGGHYHSLPASELLPPSALRRIRQPRGQEVNGMFRWLSLFRSCCHSLVSWSQIRNYYATSRAVEMEAGAPWCSPLVLLVLAGEPVCLREVVGSGSAPLRRGREQRRLLLVVGPGPIPLPLIGLATTV